MLTKSEIDRFAVLQAIYKAISPLVKTGTDGNPRAAFDAHYLDLYAETGAKSFDVIGSDGVKLGTFSVTPAMQEHYSEIVCVDPDALRVWELANDYEGFTHTVADQKAIEKHFKETGEVPNGCTVQDGIKSKAAVTRFKVDTESVLEVMGDSLPSGISGLLGE